METRTNKDGTKRYRETVTYGSRRVKGPFFKRKTDAKNWKAQELAKREKAKLFGAEYSETRKVRITDYSNEWLISRIKGQKSQATYSEYHRIIFNKIIPIVGNKFLHEFKQTDGDRLIRELQNLGHAPGGVNKILTLFKQIFREAEKDDLLFRNPVKNVQNLKEV